MRKYMIVLILMCVSAMQTSANADSFGPLPNFRKTDPTGTYYVVVKKDLTVEKKELFTSVAFELAKREAGSPPLTDAQDSLRRDSLAVTANPDVRGREGDIRLGHGKLSILHPVVLVSSTGLGFVCLDLSGHNSSSPSNVFALSIISGDGTVRQEPGGMADIFSR